METELIIQGWACKLLEHLLILQKGEAANKLKLSSDLDILCNCLQLRLRFLWRCETRQKELDLGFSSKG